MIFGGINILTVTVRLPLEYYGEYLIRRNTHIYAWSHIHFFIKKRNEIYTEILLSMKYSYLVFNIFELSCRSYKTEQTQTQTSWRTTT